LVKGTQLDSINPVLLMLVDSRTALSTTFRVLEDLRKGLHALPLLGYAEDMRVVVFVDCARNETCALGVCAGYEEHGVEHEVELKARCDEAGDVCGGRDENFA
jgi:hypothetical protein